MENSTFAWFALIGFLSPPLIGALVLIGKKDGEPPILVEGSLKAKVISLISIIGAFSCLIMVLKGFHLWKMIIIGITKYHRLMKLIWQKKNQILDVLKIENKKSDIGWGHQIRSYVLHPYRLVKDNRTNHESSSPDKVLDGEIDEFLEKSLYQIL